MGLKARRFEPDDSPPRLPHGSRAAVETIWELSLEGSLSEAAWSGLLQCSCTYAALMSSLCGTAP